MTKRERERESEREKESNECTIAFWYAVPSHSGMGTQLLLDMQVDVISCCGM